MRTMWAMLAVLFGVALAVAPLGSAWAARKPVAAAISQHHVPVIAGQVSHDKSVVGAETSMTDCERMSMQKLAPKPVGSQSSNDCPCCDPDKSCPPDMCPMKIFKVFGLPAAPTTSRTSVSLLLHPGEPQRPPDWIESPQPPPPRA